MKLEMRLVLPTQEDYCRMYEALKKLGYDPTKDIHLQFCERYGLKPKRRGKKQSNFYNYQGCSKRTKKQNPSTD